MNIYEDRIQPLFDKSGLNDAELERQIGITPKTICNWKAKRVQSYNKYIAQIASYFGVSSDYLLGKTDDPAPSGQKEKPTSFLEDGLSAELQEIIALYKEASPEVRAAMLAMLRAAEAQSKALDGGKANK